MVQIYSSIVTISIALLASLNLVHAAKTCVVQKSNSDDALSITQAFKDCQAGGTVVFPKGQSFYPKSLINVINLKNVNVQFFGNLVLPNYNTKFNGGGAFLEIRGDNINFDGAGIGTVVGSGQQWWDANNNQGPIVFRITAKNSIFRNFRIFNAPNGHMAMTGCNNVVVEKVTMHSVSKTKNYARNTDAWGCAWSDNLIFRDSVITNGDDCAAINGGVSNITVSNVKCTGGHGFSVIGALATDGRYQTFKNINIINSVCTNCLNGLTVKASPGRPGIVDGVRFQNVQLNNVDNPITLTTHYFCDASHTSACYKNDGTAIKFKNINISGITGSTSWKDLPIININCAKNTPCENVNIKNVKIQGNKTTKKNVCINILGADKIPACRA
ncbi:hypothetical protein INT47_010142 [Mucor saturninus]|uniref:Polygalacturonase n=1 Tax=Mucor saturninus TaxID=64648 RepID=A0A8H7V356_9FUNG|nr:hypothetical protein INT47_010142 [Mucor saturninus]